MTKEDKEKKAKDKEKLQRKSARRRSRQDQDQDLLVIQDLDNANEYFFYQIDAFRLNNVDYVCLASYEPDFGDHTEPELVIMRTRLDNKGTRLYKSIRDTSELESAFNAFYERMETAID